MTAKNRTSIKSVFEQGDQPQGSDYVDLIDSYVSIADSTAQSLSSPLDVTGALGASTTVSAVSVEASSATITGSVSANTVYASSATVTTLVATSVQASAVEVSGNVHVEGDLKVDGSLDLGGSAIGHLYLDATAGVSASATFVEIFSTATTVSDFLVSFENTAASLKYTGSVTKNFLVSGTITLVASGANTETNIAIAIDGSALARTRNSKEISTANEELVIIDVVRLAQNERVSLQLSGSAAAADGWLVKDFSLVVKE